MLKQLHKNSLNIFNKKEVEYCFKKIILQKLLVVHQSLLQLQLFKHHIIMMIMPRINNRVFQVQMQ